VADKEGDRNYVRNSAGEYLAVIKTVKEGIIEVGIQASLAEPIPRTSWSNNPKNINRTLGPIR